MTRLKIVVLFSLFLVISSCSGQDKKELRKLKTDENESSGKSAASGEWQDPPALYRRTTMPLGASDFRR